MRWRNGKERYGAVAKAFHWSIAVLILVQIGLGLHAASLPVGIDRLITLARHKSIGMTVFVLAAPRLAWRIFSPPPPLPPGMDSAQRALARASHFVLYALMFALPLTGWLYSSASAVSVSWFGWVALPNLVSPNAVLAHWLVRAHALLALLLGVTLILHTVAAIWHQWVRRDGVLSRMLPFSDRKAAVGRARGGS